MKIEKLIELDSKLRRIGISGVYGPWNKDNKFFSIGEESDNINAYPGNTPKDEDDVESVFIDFKKLSDKVFDILFIKNDKAKEQKILEYQEIKSYLC